VGDKEPGLQGVLSGVPHAVQRRNDHGQVGDRVPELGHVHRHLLRPRAHALYASNGDFLLIYLKDIVSATSTSGRIGKVLRQIRIQLTSSMPIRVCILP